MSWESIKIQDFAEVTTGGTPSTTLKEYWENGNIPWLNSGELNQDVITNCENYITSKGLENSSARLMPKDTVLIALTGATTGVVGYLTFEACANQSVTGILPSKNHHPKFIYYYLKSIRNKVLADAYGGAQKHISQGYVKNLEIPLPPLPIQKRIAEILDVADALKRKDQALLKKYDELAQAIFIDMFGDPVKNEKGWEVGTIRDLAREVKYGTSKPAEDRGLIPYLRMNNITYSGDWDFASLKYINLEATEYEKYIVKDGDLVFNRTNSKELVGKTAVFNLNKEMAIAGYLIRIRTNENGNPYYISYYLNSKHGKETLIGMCKSIIGMANINAQELQEINIMIPPIFLQNQFEWKIKQLKKVISKTEDQIISSSALFNSLIQKAFKGELVAE